MPADGQREASHGQWAGLAANSDGRTDHEEREGTAGPAEDETPPAASGTALAGPAGAEAGAAASSHAD